MSCAGCFPKRFAIGQSNCIPAPGMIEVSNGNVRVQDAWGGGEPFVVPESDYLMTFASLEAKAFRITRGP